MVSGGVGIGGTETRRSMSLRTLTRHAKYLWLAIPLFGLVELGASVYFSRRFPNADEWRALAAEVGALKQEKDLIVIAPEWAEPLARSAFGDSLMPIADVARPDEAGYPRATRGFGVGQRKSAARHLAGERGKALGKIHAAHAHESQRSNHRCSC